MKEKLLIAMMVITSCVHAQTTRYVKSGGTGNGSSWATASGNLQNIINASEAGDKVWVAAGTYQPVAGQSFAMKEGVEIYGGFPAIGDPEMQDRDFVIHASTLLGNNAAVVGNDGGAFLSSATKLDGFTITGGSMTLSGGGIKNINVSAVFQNLIITGNTANSGGGVNNFLGDPVFINVLIHHNNAIGSGEDSGRGGGVFNYDGNPKFINCVIADNTAELIGGGVGAVVADAEFSNTIVYGNSSPDNLQMVTIWDGSVTVRNCLIEGCGGSEMNYTINSWTFLYGPNLGGNLDQDPMFNDDYTLQPGSPCINAGKNSEYPLYGTDIDILGNIRIVDVIDMGISEYPVAITEVLYVKAGGDGDGTSWANASGDLQTMINRQVPGKEVWVAAGTYQAAVEGTYFRQKKGIKIYGGFPSSGNPTMDDRDFTANETILMGNNEIVIGNFWPDTDPLDETALLDGFTIIPENEEQVWTGVYNDYASPTLSNLVIKNNKAGGMYNFHYSSPVITNTLFKNNRAISGGAMNVAYFSVPQLTDCVFEDNNADNAGSAIWLREESAATLHNVVVRNNTSNLYGAISVSDSHVELYNVLLTGNKSSMMGSGLAMLRSTAILRNVTSSYNSLSSSIALLYESSATIDNTLVYKNTSPNAGSGIFVGLESSAVITNSTIAHNHTNFWAGSGAAVSDASAITFRNCILAENSAGHPFGAPNFLRFTDGLEPGMATFENCLVGRSGSSDNWDDTWIGTDLGNNLDTDPGFVSPDEDDYRVTRCSPVIDAGSNNFYATGAIPDLTNVTTDIMGEPRFYQEGTVDIGAYEYQGSSGGQAQTLYVSVTASGDSDGSSWGNAFTSLTQALRKACSGDEIWVAEGTYEPGAEQHFTMKNNVAIYGGFPDTGSATWEDRNWAEHPVVLQGTTSSVIANNFPQHDPLTNSAVLDGFTISNGKGLSGVGMISGGGVYNNYASPILRNLIIANNQAQAGGGIFGGEQSEVQLINVLIYGNAAEYGGGGASFHKSPAQVINTTITNNSANTGGGVGIGEANDVMFKNCIIYGNTANIELTANVSTWQSNVNYQYCLIQGSGGSTAWNTELGTDGGNNIDVDPQFEAGYKIPLASPAADSGNAALYPQSAGEFDLMANPRIFGSGIDMGAYEANNGLGIDEMNQNNDFVIYPNPASGIINFQLEYLSKIETISIFDMTGKKIYSANSNNSNSVDVSLFSAGIYVICITNGDSTLSSKFIKK